MKTPAVILACAVIAAALAAIVYRAASRAEHKQARENIILIVADAMRADALGKTINGYEVTPNLNRLAAEGVTFTRAYSASSWTKPSVASILTGMYPPGHGVEYPTYTLPDCPTLPKFLSERGYVTVAVVSNPFLFAELGGDGTKKPMDFGFNSSFAFYREIPEESGPLSVWATGQKVNTSFLSVLANRKVVQGKAAFFAYLHYMDTHQPWLTDVPIPGVTGRLRSNARSDKRTPEETLGEDRKLVGEIVLESKKAMELTEEQKTLLRDIYYEACAHFDYHVGALLGELKKLGIYDSTTIIFTADHGDELAEHGHIGHAQNIYAASLHVPLIIKRRGMKAARIDTLVSNVSIFPTIAEYFGSEVIATNAVSFVPYIEGTARGTADIFATLAGTDKAMLADGRTVLYESATGRTACFDTTTDPQETKEIAAGDDLAESPQRMRRQSEQLAREAGIRRRFSTYAWQNIFANAQDALAKEAVAKGEMTAAEAARQRSFGGFLPKEAEEALRSVKGLRVDASNLSEEEKERLRALGYVQ